MGAVLLGIMTRKYSTVFKKLMPDEAKKLQDPDCDILYKMDREGIGIKYRNNPYNRTIWLDWKAIVKLYKIGRRSGGIKFEAKL